jgi:hypothetical protein
MKSGRHLPVEFGKAKHFAVASTKRQNFDRRGVEVTTELLGPRMALAREEATLLCKQHTLERWALCHSVRLRQIGSPRVMALCVGSDRYSACVIDPMKKKVQIMVSDVFVNGFPSAFPMTVIIDDQDSAGFEQREKMN